MIKMLSLHHVEFNSVKMKWVLYVIVVFFLSFKIKISRTEIEKVLFKVGLCICSWKRASDRTKKCSELTMDSELRLWCRAMEAYTIRLLHGVFLCAFPNIINIYNSTPWVNNGSHQFYICSHSLLLTCTSVHSSFVSSIWMYYVCAHSVHMHECNKFAKEKHAIKNANTKRRKK